MVGKTELFGKHRKRSTEKRQFLSTLNLGELFNFDLKILGRIFPFRISLYLIVRFFMIIKIIQLHCSAGIR